MSRFFSAWLAIALALPAVAQPAATSRPAASGWSMFRADAANTGVAQTSLPEKLRLKWKFDTLAARKPASSPTATSKPIPEPIESTAAIAAGVVYFGCDDTHLYALDLASGKEKWRFKARGSIRSSPTLAGAAVYFGDDEGWMYSLDAARGEKRWEFETKGEIISSPVLADGKLIFGSYDGVLYCLDPAGKLLWKYDTEDKLHATPGIADGHVLIAGCDGKLHVVALADGAPVRKVSIGAPCGASAAIAGPQAYVATQGNQILGVNWKDGRVAWAFEDPDRQFPFLSSAAVGDKLIFVGGRDKRLRALQRDTGEVAWSYTARKKIDVSPVIVGKRLFCADENGDLYALDLETGKELWKYESGSAFIASPAVGEGCVIIGSADGVLYCFGE